MIERERKTISVNKCKKNEVSKNQCFKEMKKDRDKINRLMSDAMEKRKKENEDDNEIIEKINICLCFFNFMFQFHFYINK